MEILVFVYGTLMRGQGNARFLEGAEFVRPAETGPGFELFSMGSFPAMSRGGKASVKGELYLVDDDTLKVLDSLENHPRLYRREEIDLDDGGEAIAYLLDQAREMGGTPIKSGNWRTLE